jgi:methylase of polypeptide subunit release factors
MLLVPLDAQYRIPLPRAPDIQPACLEAFGRAERASVLPLRAVLGLIGAHEWRTKGIEIPAIAERIYPHYGVFAPIRREYVELVAKAPLPAASTSLGTAFDIGTGTGVLAAVLARRGLPQVIATDSDARALACARDNVARLGLAERITIVAADLFPEGRASLIVCNPPWIPARPSAPIERGIYDPQSQMLRGFLQGLPAHLERDGEGWLVLSDLAEHLGLRPRSELTRLFEAAGLVVIDRIDAKPTHRRASDTDDPLYAARSAEVTSLWRLTAAGSLAMGSG